MSERESNLIVVYCGQWGSTGKGNVTALVTEEERAEGRMPIGVRVGGPNAGHTFEDASGEKRSVQQVPISAFVAEDAVAVIGAAGLILPEVMHEELHALIEMRKKLGWEPPTILIDKGATIIEQRHMEAEAGLKERISSTGEGVGAATAERVMREALTFSDAEEELARKYPNTFGRGDMVHAADTVRWLNLIFQLEHSDHSVILEGTQGTLLGLYTSGYYPYTTSREITPDAILSQVGLSRAHVSPASFRAICVMRTYPIRVGGPSGPLPHEVTWEQLAERTDGWIEPERTTVTKKIRRIAEIDWLLAKRVLWQTRPTEIALTFVDYKKPPPDEAKVPDQEHDRLAEFICSESFWPHVRPIVEWFESGHGLPIPTTIVGYGPTQRHYRRTFERWLGGRWS